MHERRIYLDYAATTPVDPEVVRAMEPYFAGKFGNPGSLHQFGQEALAAVDESRAAIARFLHCEFREVIFTGSATEANNLALRGVVKRQTINDPFDKTQGRLEQKSKDDERQKLPHIVTSAIEHESVLETCRDLEESGEAEVTYVGVSPEGVVDLDELERALRPETVLVSVMYANNETGTIQPITKISEIIRNFREQIANSPEAEQARYGAGKSQIAGHKPFALSHLPLLHTDAAQAAQFLDCDVRALGADLMTLSAHKIYGPKGIGALYVRRQMANGKWQMQGHSSAAIGDLPFAISPLITGGGQEYGMRAATENVPSIVGFAKAIELVERNREKQRRRIEILREYLWRGIMRAIPHAVRFTPEKPDWALPHILSVSFPGASGEELLFRFDRLGIGVSTGSACQSRACRPSHVLAAMGVAPGAISSAIRFSLGRPTAAQDIERTIRILTESV